MNSRKAETNSTKIAALFLNGEGADMYNSIQVLANGKKPIALLKKRIKELFFIIGRVSTFPGEAGFPIFASLWGNNSQCRYVSCG